MWGDLSPAASEAQREAQGRRSYARWAYWLRLGRTSRLAVIDWPRYIGRARRAKLAAVVAARLPEYHYNARLERWEAELSRANVRAALDRLAEIEPSDGINQFLAQEQNDE